MSSVTPVAAVRTGLTGLVRARTRDELLYLLVGLPFAVAGFLFVIVSTVLGVALAATFIGLPLLAAAGRAARGLGTAQRRLAARLLGEEVAPPPPFVSGRGFFGWLQSALTDGASWRARAYLLIKLPLGLFILYVAAVFWVLGLFYLTYPLWWRLSGSGTIPKSIFLDLRALIFRAGAAPGRVEAHRITLHTGGVYFDTWPRALLISLCGLAVLVAAPWVVRGLVQLDRWLMRALLGRAPGSRVRELEAARAQVVDDSASTLRRIERDLHDGTQAQLATLAMTLGQAKEKLERRPDVPFDTAGALALVDSAHRHAKEALVELRDIARGIHPPALDLGLDAALSTLVARSAVPATLSADLPTRPSRGIETIAYFSAAELLANAAKHSKARHVEVEVCIREGRLWLSVRDDGVGGAAIPADGTNGAALGAGSGLPGLLERVRAVDGRLELDSSPGGPTTITIELPLTA